MILTELKVPMPIELSDVLRQLTASLDEQSTIIPLPTGLTPQVLVPLAGFLLEYPVSYVPTSADQAIFLSSTPLNIFECIIFLPGDLAYSEHIMFKFSCPAQANLDRRLNPGFISETLQSRFTERLKDIEGSRIEVRHHVETLGNVAL